MLDLIKSSYKEYQSIPLGSTANTIGRKIASNNEIYDMVTDYLTRIRGTNPDWMTLAELQEIQDELKLDKETASNLLDSVRSEDIQYLVVGERTQDKVAVNHLLGQGYQLPTHIDQDHKLSSHLAWNSNPGLVDAAQSIAEKVVDKVGSDYDDEWRNNLEPSQARIHWICPVDESHDDVWLDIGVTDPSSPSYQGTPQCKVCGATMIDVDEEQVFGSKTAMEDEWKCESCGSTQIIEGKESFETVVVNHDYCDPGTYGVCPDCGGKLRYLDSYLSSKTARFVADICEMGVKVHEGYKLAGSYSQDPKTWSTGDRVCMAPQDAYGKILVELGDGGHSILWEGDAWAEDYDEQEIRDNGIIKVKSWDEVEAKLAYPYELPSEVTDVLNRYYPAMSEVDKWQDTPEAVELLQKTFNLPTDQALFAVTQWAKVRTDLKIAKGYKNGDWVDVPKDCLPDGEENARGQIIETDADGYHISVVDYDDLIFVPYGKLVNPRTQSSKSLGEAWKPDGTIAQIDLSQFEEDERYDDIVIISRMDGNSYDEWLVSADTWDNRSKNSSVQSGIMPVMASSDERGTEVRFQAPNGEMVEGIIWSWHDGFVPEGHMEVMDNDEGIIYQVKEDGVEFLKQSSYLAPGDRVQIKDWHPDVPGHGMKWQDGVIERADTSLAQYLVRVDEFDDQLVGVPFSSKDIKKVSSGVSSVQSSDGEYLKPGDMVSLAEGHHIDGVATDVDEETEEVRVQWTDESVTTEMGRDLTIVARPGPA